MGSDNVYERLWKQELSVRKLILDGKRDPEEVSRVLQSIIWGRKLVEVNLTPDNLLSQWENFYWDSFGEEFHFTGLTIPPKRAGFDRLLVVAPGMFPQRLFDKCAQFFPSWKYTDKNLDEIITSDRTAKDGAYAVWVRDRVEADEELKNLSAEQLKEQNVSGITFEERLLYELKFFKETGGHLDVANRTLCSGSRDSGGGVPRVRWDDAKFRVGWYSPRGAYSYLRARAVVS